MGLLADSRIRSKISKDPNNTKWARDTSSFGRKILQAQGWRPGQFLGVENAAHSSLYTAANASFIRVSVKDDIKGLGFDKAKEAEITGLDVFSDLLSRLNGKSSVDIEDEKLARMAFKTNRYVEQKWGPMRFVKGGLLVGENVLDSNAAEQLSSSHRTTEAQAPIIEARTENGSKKRRAVDIDDGTSEQASRKELKRRKKGKEEKRDKKDGKSSSEAAPDEEVEKSSTRSKKKTREHKKNSGKHELSTSDELEGEKTRNSSKKKGSRTDGDATSRKKGKTRKMDKGEENRRSKTSATHDPDEAAVGSDPKSSPLPSMQKDIKSSTPEPLKGGRNFARSRFIAAKRQAMLDAKALNQIFMVKA